MLWVYGNYKYFYSYIAGIDFRRQNLSRSPLPVQLFQIARLLKCCARCFLRPANRTALDSGLRAQLPVSAAICIIDHLTFVTVMCTELPHGGQ